MEVLVVDQLEKTQSKDSASLSSFMLSHCCLYAIQMSIIMITKEEMWTASMTRQSDTPSFHSAHLPESDAEVFMTSFRTYLVAHWIMIEPSHVLGRWQKSPVSQSSFSSSMANHSTPWLSRAGAAHPCTSHWHSRPLHRPPLQHTRQISIFSAFLHSPDTSTLQLLCRQSWNFISHRLTQWASSSAWWKQPNVSLDCSCCESQVELFPARYCVESSQPGEKFYCWESFTQTRFSRIWMIQSLFPPWKRKQNGASLGWMTLRGEKEEEEGEDFSLVWRIGLARSWYPRRTTNPLNPSLHVQLCNSAYCENIQQQIW